MVSSRFRRKWGGLPFGIALFGLYLTSHYNYLLFHSLSEIFSIVVAAGIFMLAWNSRRLSENSYLLFLGVAYLFVGSLDLLHTLSYKGVHIFQESGANLPTQLWIAARYMESVSLLISPLFLNKEINPFYLFFSYMGVTACLIIMIFFTGFFPDCFLEKTGMTPFKKNSEVIICLILLGAIGMTMLKKAQFDPLIFRLIVSSILLTICAELAFTFYISVYGFSNLVGHILKIISFYLIYKAIIEKGLREPYELLFRNTKKSEQALRKQRDQLEEALSEINTLSGLLPICASCKKIRDDKGCWKHLETYIRDHSEADFTHSICPECAKRFLSES